MATTPAAHDVYADLPVVGTVETWSKILGVHPQSLRKACRGGELRYVTIGRLWKIPRHAVIDWLLSSDNPDRVGVSA